MKLIAVAQRAAKRDFVDLYAMALRYRPLTELLGLCRRKYGLTDVANILYGLTYFDDAEDQPMPRMLWKADWHAVKKSICQWVREV